MEGGVTADHLLPPPPRSGEWGWPGWVLRHHAQTRRQRRAPTPTLPTLGSQGRIGGVGDVRQVVAVLSLLLGLLLWPVAATAQTAAPPAAERCQALAGDRFAGLPGAPTQIVSATYSAAANGKVAACVVEGYVAPTVNFAMLLPADNWNGRYLVRGCGGSCGTVAVELACASHLRDGYACLHTDMGHRSTLIDNIWVKDNLQGLVDFGYRATHVTTVAGRAVLRAFYGADARKSYFFACSTGGRQGLIEAQRFPEDFDGIVAIAPASMAPFGNRKAASVADVDGFNTGVNGLPTLPNRKTLLLHRGAVAACDKGDGIMDGLIGDPEQCGFKPAALLCKTGDSADCLTAAQVAVADKIYRLHGAMPGSEFNWIGNYLRNATLPGETSQPVFDLAIGRGDPATIETLNTPNNPDLRPFRDNGGKLILVHGWADHSVMPPPTLDYYQTVERTMGGPAPTRAFARLFMIPGMDHCAGGEGAYAINYMAAITDWVEGGKAPEALRGIHPVAGAPLDYFGVDLPFLDPKYIAFQRDHQAYPGRSVAVKGAAVVAAPLPARPLAQALAEAAINGERTGTAAGFPRRSVLNLVLKSMWEVLYRSPATLAEQQAALAALTGLPPVAAEAVLRMRAELALN